jgi:hypothetical protein
MSSSNLKLAQGIVQVVRVFGRWLIVLVLGLYALAAYLARGERRVAIRRVGWALVVVGLGLLVTRKVGGNYVVDAVTTPTYRETGHHVWTTATAVLGEIGWAAVLYGLALVLAMVLAGGTRWARATRHAISPVVIDRQGVAWGVLGGLLLVLVLWGGTHALRTWWGVALIAILLAAGLVALRRQVLEEREEAAPPQEGDEPSYDPAGKLAMR